MNKEENDIILYDQDKVVKKGQKILKIVYIISIVGILGMALLFVSTLSPVDKNSNIDVVFVINDGDTANKVIEDLQKQNLIKSSFFTKIYLKISSSSEVYKGSYKLSKSMSAIDIIDTITSGNGMVSEAVEIMFVTGKRLPYYVTKISEAYNISEEEVNEVFNDKTYLQELINKYWFLTDEILDQNIYYPLEGYLWPDTYKFNKDATVKQIIETLLDQTDTKLSVYKDDIALTEKSVHSLLTLASMVELEAVTAEDRAGVASVFNNRIKLGMTLGSDVTTYYAAKKEMTDEIFKKELDACNAYNTRSTCLKGLPVGPICSPSESAIVAALKPSEANNLYFVADKNRKVYFNETYAGHNATIADLKKQNLWA